MKAEEREGVRERGGRRRVFAVADLVLHKDSASAVIPGRRGPCRYALPPLWGRCSDGRARRGKEEEGEATRVGAQGGGARISGSERRSTCSQLRRHQHEKVAVSLCVFCPTVVVD